MNENINGNRVFSQELKQNDFQTEHMKNKIRNIKKKKNLNIKNIEPLVNIHDKPSDYSNEPIIEGLNLNPIVTFKDEEWTGNDDIYEGGKKAVHTSKSFAEVIEDAYKSLSDKYHNSIKNLTKTISGETYVEDDVKHVKKYFSWILSIIIGVIAVYNWIFVTFYKDKQDIKIELYETPRDYIYTKSGLSPFFKIIDKFTNIPLFFPDYLQKIFVQWIPDGINSAIDPDGESRVVMLFIFMMLLAGFTVYTYHSGSLIKDILVDIASFEFSGILTMIIYAITFVLFIISFMETNPLAALLPIGGVLSLAKFMNPIFWIEKFIILIYLIFIGVPLATCMCLIYIIVHTFGSILIYKEHYTISEVIKLIDEFLEEHKLRERSDSACNPLGFWDKIVNYTIKIINFIYEHCISLGFIIVMLYALIDSGINIKSNVLKLVIMVITLGGVGSVVITNIISMVKAGKNIDVNDILNVDVNDILNVDVNNTSNVDVNNTSNVDVNEAFTENPILSTDNIDSVKQLAQNLKDNNNEQIINTLNNFTKNL